MAPQRSWTKANNPYWSTHVATWYRGHQEAEEYCRRRKLSRTAFDRWARHLVSPEDLRKRLEHLRKLRWNELVLALDDLESDIGQVGESHLITIAETAGALPKRKPLPDHLPREEILLDVPSDACPCCGGNG